MKDQKNEQNLVDEMHKECRVDIIEVIEAWEDRWMELAQALYSNLSITIELILSNAPDKVELLAMIGTALAQEAHHYKESQENPCPECKKLEEEKSNG